MAVYSSKVMNESAVTTPVVEAVNPLQFAIDIQRDDLRLFSAVIEADFAEAYSEAGLRTLSESEISSLLEAEGQKFGEKISAAIAKVKEFVKNIITKFLANVDKLLANDEGLVKKYSAYVTKEKCAGCEVKQETIDEKVYDEFVSGLKGAITRAETEAIKDEISAEQIQASTDTLSKLIEEKANKIVKEAGEAKLVDTVSFETMVEVIGHGKGASIKNDAKKFQTTAEDVMAKAERAAKAKLGSSENKEDNAKLNDLYKAVVGLSNLVSKACTLYVKFAGKKLSVYRKNYITLGAWAMRNEGKAAAPAEEKPIERVEGEVVDSKNESTYEETYAALIEEASDMFTEDLFSLVY